jgi:hypothetical protein
VSIFRAALLARSSSESHPNNNTKPTDASSSNKRNKNLKTNENLGHSLEDREDEDLGSDSEEESLYSEDTDEPELEGNEDDGTTLD